jgi:KDO2-lipid IV(A) lauroyltransferase
MANAADGDGSDRAHHGAFLRRLAFMGARHGPSAFVRYSPPMFGAVFALALGDVRHRVRDNLRAVHGRRAPLRESRDVVRTFADYAACLAESLGSGRGDASRARVDVTGGEHLNQVLSDGRGAVMVTAHVGPWDVAASLLARDIGARIAIVMEREPNAEAQALHDEVRKRNGVTVLTIGDTSLDALPVLRKLRQGGIVAFQLDRAPPSARVLEARLFGRRFQVPEGPFRLASLARVPVLPVFAARRGYFEYAVEISAPIFPKNHAAGEDLEELSKRALAAMERFIRLHPTQWFHFGQALPERDDQSPPSSGAVPK